MYFKLFKINHIIVYIFIYNLSICCFMACRRNHTQSPEMVSIGPETKADMVFVFEKSTSEMQIEEFIDKDLSDVRSNGRWPKQGIQMFTRITTKLGQPGIAVYLEPCKGENPFPKKFIATTHSLSFDLIRNARPKDL